MREFMDGFESYSILPPPVYVKVQRTWSERLWSWPWCPWQKHGYIREDYLRWEEDRKRFSEVDTVTFSRPNCYADAAYGD